MPRIIRLTLNTPMTNSELKKELQAIAEQRENSIEKAVAIEVLDCDNIQAFFTDLFQFGCVSGMIGSLVWWTDTHAFFDTHYDEIEDIRKDFEEETGLHIPIKYDLKNSYAWFAFQETAWRMANRFEIEV